MVTVRDFLELVGKLLQGVKTLRNAEREERLRFFESQIQPVYEQLRAIHKDYLEIAIGLRRRLAHDDFDAAETVEWLRQSRIRLQFERSELANLQRPSSNFRKDSESNDWTEILEKFVDALRGYFKPPGYPHTMIGLLALEFQAVMVARAITKTAEELARDEVLAILNNPLCLAENVATFIAQRPALTSKTHITDIANDLSRRRLDAILTEQRGARLAEYLAKQDLSLHQLKANELEELAVRLLLEDNQKLAERVGLANISPELGSLDVRSLVATMTEVAAPHFSVADGRPTVATEIRDDTYWMTRLRRYVDHSSEALEGRLATVQRHYHSLRAALLA